MTLSVSEDFRAEIAELHGFLATLDEQDWATPTRFFAWTPWDIVAHLHFFDEVSRTAVAGREAFEERARTLLAKMGQVPVGGSKAIARSELGALEAPVLLERWRRSADALAEELGRLDPKARLPWFGPDMGVAMFTTARFMETWSHAQAIYDEKQIDRPHSDRVRNIVAIGIKTFGWTFANRDRPLPGPPPYVRLTAPSGAIWAYHEPSEVERIEGSAVDFCMTVTQTRNVQDTGLRVIGDVANRWMEIAQCFAGPPVDPPEPGYRTLR